MRNHKSLTLNLRMDSDTRILWGVMERHDSVDSSLHSAVDLWCSKQVGKKGKILAFQIFFDCIAIADLLVA